MQANVQLRAPTVRPSAPTTLRLRCARTASSCANLYSSARELRIEKRNSFAPSSTALLKWVAVEYTAALTKPQNFGWIRRGCHIFGLPIIMKVSGLSRSKEGRRFLSAVAASLSSASPEEDSASGSSEGLGREIHLNLPRRRLQLSFTCDACGTRSQRLINPDAYARGTVFVQCAGCEVYHKLVDNLGLIEEYDFRNETNGKADGADLNVVE